MSGHQLILGKLVDFITGETLKDTHDERYRQKIGRLLVKQKGYLKADIEPRNELLVQADAKKAILKIDFVVTLRRHSGRPGLHGCKVRPRLAGDPSARSAGGITAHRPGSNTGCRHHKWGRCRDNERRLR
jgi:hypothetical protein